MLQAILHRGPDDLGLWEDDMGDACLLHARLALVDPDGGKQPMTGAGGNVVIVFNGEIYGFERARRELEARGVAFRTRCDTEVLLQLYLQFGPNFVRDLEGEFAFVLLDRRSGQVMRRSRSRSSTRRRNWPPTSSIRASCSLAAARCSAVSTTC